MPLLEHIRELRTRLVRAVIVIVIGSIVSFIFYQDIIEFLIQPVCDSDVRGVAGG
jgi:sec-independent protein translocase protein TatC